MPEDSIQTIEIFEKPIKYDRTKVYGLFSSQGQYGTLPVEKTLARWASAGDRKQFLTFLDTQLKSLESRSDNNAKLDALVDANILQVTGSPQSTLEVARRHREIKNTIGLYEHIIESMRS